MFRIRAKGEKRLGVISDTHGLLRPEVAEVFVGVRLILHAGDIGTRDVINDLRSIAPVVAVRGNNDKGSWARAIPETEVVQVDDIRIFMVHSLNDAEINAEDRRIRIVISGHSHRPSMEIRDGVLFMNPGSAGPRRFKLPIAVGRLTIHGSVIKSEIIDLFKNG
jgi:putative phosphoesterase